VQLADRVGISIEPVLGANSAAFQWLTPSAPRIGAYYKLEA
jgi:hypothetical protein